MRPILALVLLTSALPEWRAGSFHGVVTGQARLEAARRAFGAPINDVVDDRDESVRRMTFRPLTVEVPAVDGGTPSSLQIGVQVFLDRATRRVVRIRLTPWPESHTTGVALAITPVDRRILKQIIDVPFEERRIDYCAGGPLWAGGISTHGDPDPVFFLLAPEHGVAVHLQDRKFLGDIEFSATPPEWLEKNPCPTTDLGPAL